MNVKSDNELIDAVGSSVGSVQVLATKMRIRDLSIERPDVISYLQTIVPEKQEIALVHAIAVGITEIVARRERFGMSANARVRTDRSSEQSAQCK